VKASHPLANFLRSEDRQSVSNVRRCKSPARGQANCSLQRRDMCSEKNSKQRNSSRVPIQISNLNQNASPSKSQIKIPTPSPICPHGLRSSHKINRYDPRLCVAETNICCSKLKETLPNRLIFDHQGKHLSIWTFVSSYFGDELEIDSQ